LWPLIPRTAPPGLHSPTVSRSLVLDMGCHRGQSTASLRNSGKIGALLQMDVPPAMAALARRDNGLPTACGDEEALPFATQSLDLDRKSTRLNTSHGKRS